ncbi:MAG: hypothetical protein OEZ01_15190 [Candidatus Heimdallarchaeota archaeon]|nr:hypothetical protein [Candidatus Heimdallarchaeota archaeon]MDH5647353.1 hypothetical protein [Candidatus Heimdallarchaeota archaeon]
MSLKNFERYKYYLEVFDFPNEIPKGVKQHFLIIIGVTGILEILAPEFLFYNSWNHVDGEYIFLSILTMGVITFGLYLLFRAQKIVSEGGISDDTIKLMIIRICSLSLISKLLILILRILELIRYSNSDFHRNYNYDYYIRLDGIYGVMIGFVNIYIVLVFLEISKRRIEKAVKIPLFSKLLALLISTIVLVVVWLASIILYFLVLFPFMI